MSSAQPIGLAGGKIVLAHRGRQADSKPLFGRTDPLLRRPIAGKQITPEDGSRNSSKSRSSVTHCVNLATAFSSHAMPWPGLSGTVR